MGHRFIVQNSPFRLDKPTGAVSCSPALTNYKSSARGRRPGTGRDQMSPKIFPAGIWEKSIKRR